ncbi:hypothetical protein TNCV_3907631 [Trichonephila clavipes]|nr:hypothetical protein TNCV_3907631 [Trichonephila clavipes]
MVQAFVAYTHKPMTLHSPTENGLAVLNHKILEANSRVQNVRKLGGHQTCLLINQLWHELGGHVAPSCWNHSSGHHDCSPRMKKLANHGSIPITIDCNVVAFIVFEEVRTNDSTSP